MINKSRNLVKKKEFIQNQMHIQVIRLMKTWKKKLWNII